MAFLSCPWKPEMRYEIRGRVFQDKLLKYFSPGLCSIFAKPKYLVFVETPEGITRQQVSRDNAYRHRVSI